MSISSCFSIIPHYFVLYSKHFITALFVLTMSRLLLSLSSPHPPVFIASFITSTGADKEHSIYGEQARVAESGSLYSISIRKYHVSTCITSTFFFFRMACSDRFYFILFELLYFISLISTLFNIFLNLFSCFFSHADRMLFSI